MSYKYKKICYFVKLLQKREMMFDLVSEQIEKYAENHTTPENEILRKINRETHAQVLSPRMLSGHLQGQFLAFISKMIQPQQVLEIGTYTGYSAICLAQGLAENGQLHTIDVNDELENRVKNYISEAHLQHKIVQHIGNAAEIIPTLDQVWDLVFIDADKKSYAHYFDLVINNVKKSGFIIADNVLWSGKVINEKVDADTQCIIDFNKKIQEDSRVENVLLPVRDGLLIMRKL